jgi:hypothetical protein
MRASRPAFSFTARSGHAVRLPAHSEFFLQAAVRVDPLLGDKAVARNPRGSVKSVHLGSPQTRPL